MRQLHRYYKTMQFVMMAVLTLACCTGCTIVDALLDGVFLGFSEAVSALVSATLGG